MNEEKREDGRMEPSELVEKMAQAGAEDSLPRNGMFNSDQLDSMKSERLPDYRRIASVMLKAIDFHSHQQAMQDRILCPKCESIYNDPNDQGCEVCQLSERCEGQNKVICDQAQAMQAAQEEIALLKANAKAEDSDNDDLLTMAHAEYAELEQRAERLQEEVDDAKIRLDDRQQRLDDQDKERNNFYEKIERQRATIDGLVSALTVAQPIVCSMRCPSVKYGPEPWTHHEDCIKVQTALEQANAALAAAKRVR